LNRRVQPGPAVDFYEFGTGRVSRIGVLEGPFGGWGFSVSPDERSIIYSVAKTKNDVVLVENFR
jgi:hypothetical protein